MTSNFTTEFMKVLLRGCFDHHLENRDRLRFPDKSRGLSRLRGSLRRNINRAARRLGFVPLANFREDIPPRVSAILDCAADYETLYQALGNDASRHRLTALLAFRILGAEHIRLQPDIARYRNAEKIILKHLKKKTETHYRSGMRWHLDYYELNEIGFPIRLHVHPVNVLNTFMLTQYVYAEAGSAIHAKPGDIVIDGGGCWGDTALYFANAIGQNGKVFSFEFTSANLDVFRTNLKLNPDLASRIEIVPEALWDKSDVPLNFSEKDAGTAVSSQSTGENSVTSRTIDDFVKERKLQAVDFIKMDIEGSEMNALHGAVNTLIQFRPRLAISAYHRNSDLLDISRFVDNLQLGYRVFIGHCTLHKEETMIFAEVPKTQA